MFGENRGSIGKLSFGEATNFNFVVNETGGMVHRLRGWTPLEKESSSTKRTVCLSYFRNYERKQEYILQYSKTTQANDRCLPKCLHACNRS